MDLEHKLSVNNHSNINRSPARTSIMLSLKPLAIFLTTNDIARVKAFTVISEMFGVAVPGL